MTPSWSHGVARSYGAAKHEPPFQPSSYHIVCIVLPSVSSCMESSIRRDDKFRKESERGCELNSITNKN